MLIKAEHLKLSLDGHPILEDVSLHLERAMIYGLLGPNGAGKSSTIAVLLGLYAAQAGTLKLFDEPADGASADIRRRIGIMPESAGFYGWMSARDYLVWYAGFYGNLQQSIPHLLGEVGLGAVGDRPIGQFSQGMRQRLALARALVHMPELLILDEPTNGLDPRGRREIHDLLLGLARERDVGILLCTHLLDDVDRLCNRIGIIAGGRTVLEGPLVEILGREGVTGRFGLRLQSAPRRTELPEGLTLLGQEGSWWNVQLSSAPRLAAPHRVWRLLLEHGWPIVEVRTEGGGLEDLYLRLTGDGVAGEARLEAAA